MDTPSDLTFHQWVTRMDGAGGYAVVETDNPASVVDGPAKFGPYFEFEVVPVMDLNDTVPIAEEAIKFRESVK